METIKEMLQNKNELITIISGTSVYDAVLFMAEISYLQLWPLKTKI